MTHDKRILKNEEQIEALKKTVPDWIRNLKRPLTPALSPPFGPLEGIRAVGTGVFVAQPYIGTKLAEFGAEVIHVERPGGETFRRVAPHLTRGLRPHGCDTAEINKNKLSMGLDLKRARGVELLMALWKISDVWMESSMPGTCERTGLPSELAPAVNPSLVIVKVSTYGQFGKQEHLERAGYDAIAQAYGGMMHVTATYGHTGNRSSECQPYDTFKCSDGWVFIAAIGGAIYARMPRFLGLDPNIYSFEACSKDPAAVNSERGRELDRRLREYCAARTCLEVETELNKAQIGCSRVFSAEDQYADEHYAAREMTVPVLDRQSGVPIRVYGVAPKLSLTPGRIWRGSPSVGEDTNEVLAKLLHFSESDIARLYEDQIVHRTEPITTPQVPAVHPQPCRTVAGPPSVHAPSRRRLRILLPGQPKIS